MRIHEFRKELPEIVKYAHAISFAISRNIHTMFTFDVMESPLYIARMVYETITETTDILDHVDWHSNGTVEQVLSCLVRHDVPVYGKSRFSVASNMIRMNMVLDDDKAKSGRIWHDEILGLFMPSTCVNPYIHTFHDFILQDEDHFKDMDIIDIYGHYLVSMKRSGLDNFNFRYFNMPLEKEYMVVGNVFINGKQMALLEGGITIDRQDLEKLDTVVLDGREARKVEKPKKKRLTADSMSYFARRVPDYVPESTQDGKPITQHKLHDTNGA